ncbi:MAG TPA: hydrolase TatD, partial [Candidatus Wolfebacteria bacterium]|nr:hydrolase TatD [Candidatus Wolfebacteria bacterium]
MLIDTHCHLDSKDFDKDREEVIKRARKVGVQKMINVGCDIKQSKNSIALAEKYDFIYAAVGLHPHE